MTQPEVSIVVCTRNRAPMLRDALASLAGLDLENDCRCEIVVVDNGSTDDTSQVVETAARQSNCPIVRIYEAQPGVAKARNRGIAASRGTWIAFFDDDQLAAADWLQRLLMLAQEKNASCTGGAVVLKLPEGFDRPLSAFCRRLLGETVGRDAIEPYSPRFTPGTGNMLVRRELLQQLNGFDTAFAQRGEDTDLFLRMHAAGFAAWYTPSAVVQHVIPRDRLRVKPLLRISWNSGVTEMPPEGRWSGLQFCFTAAIRTAQAGLAVLPRLLWATLCFNRAEAFGQLCRLVFIAGFCVAFARWLWPRNESVAATAVYVPGEAAVLAGKGAGHAD